VTFRAVDATTGSVVAVKECPLGHDARDAKVRELLAREGEVLARLDHPQIPDFVASFYWGHGKSTAFYLVQDFVDGTSLDRRSWTSEELEPVISGCLEALSYLHGLQPPVVHRDVKPSNILIRDDGRVYLVDFGMVRVLRGGLAGSTLEAGTVGYQAPEQITGAACCASDVYGVAATALACWTGEFPPTRWLAFDVGGQHLEVPSDLPGVRRSVVEALRRMLSASASDRPSNATEALAMWQAACRGESPSAVAASTPQGAASGAGPAVGAGVTPARADAAPAAQTVGMAERSPRPVRWGSLGAAGWRGPAAAAVVFGLSWLLPAYEVLPEAVTLAAPRVVNAGVPALADAEGPRLAPWESPSLGTMVHVPRGTFTMGGEPGRDDVAGRCDSDETPHPVTLTQSYYLMEHEVTQGEWQAVMGSNPSEFTSCGSRCPVERVSWDDVQAFIAKVSARDGVTYRLPTEAEWERAARGGQAFAYAGSNELDAVGWYGENSGDRTHPVCAKSRNGYGLCDMTGNVWEWVGDWKADYGSASATDPRGPSTGSNRVIRGGGWSYGAGGARVACRYGGAPAYRFNALGFRLLRSVP
jgi:formylglycine-generating enzyme required for sulfatase activity